MATAIVPQTDTVRPSNLLTAYEATYAEVRSLALFLCEEDDLTFAQAMCASPPMIWATAWRTPRRGTAQPFWLAMMTPAPSRY